MCRHNQKCQLVIEDGRVLLQKFNIEIVKQLSEENFRAEPPARCREDTKEEAEEVFFCSSLAKQYTSMQICKYQAELNITSLMLLERLHRFIQKQNSTSSKNDTPRTDSTSLFTPREHILHTLQSPCT